MQMCVLRPLPPQTGQPGPLASGRASGGRGSRGLCRIGGRCLVVPRFKDFCSLSSLLSDGKEAGPVCWDGTQGCHAAGFLLMAPVGSGVRHRGVQGWFGLIRTGLLDVRAAFKLHSDPAQAALDLFNRENEIHRRDIRPIFWA